MYCLTMSYWLLNPLSKMTHVMTFALLPNTAKITNDKILAKDTTYIGCRIQIAFFNLYFTLWMRMFWSHVCVFTTCVPIGSSGIGVMDECSHHAGAWNWAYVHCKSIQLLLTKQCLHPEKLILKCPGNFLC